MLNLNFSNVEELVFYDTEVQKLLPVHMVGLFEQWRLAKRVPFLRDIGKQAILDFLNNLNESDVEILEHYFGDKIILEKLNYSIALNFKVLLTDSKLCEELCAVEGFNYFSTWRDGEYLYISFWR